MKKITLLLTALVWLLAFSATAEVMKLDSEVPMYIVASFGGYDLMAADGTVIAEDWAEDVDLMKNGLICVRMNGLYGFMDRKGRWLTEPCYSYAALHSYEGFSKVKKDGLIGFIDSEAREVVPCEYEDAGNFSCGYAAVRKNGKWGYVDTRGELVIEPRFDDAGSFDADGHAFVFVNECVGVIDISGNYLREPEYRKYGKSGDYYIIREGSERNERYGCLFSDGTLIEPRWSNFMWSFEGGFAAVSEENKLWGYIDRQGNVVIEPRFESAGSFKNGRAIVMENGKFGVIDSNGVYVYAPEYDYIRSVYGCDGVYFVEKDGRMSVLRADGTLWDRYYDYIYEENGLYVLEENGLYGLADENGDFLLEPYCREIYYVGDGFAAVTYEEVDDNAWYGGGEAGNSVLVAFGGKRLSDEVYDDVFLCGDGTVMVDKDGVRRTYKIENGAMSEVEVIKNALDLNDYAPFTGKLNAAGTLREDIGFDNAYALPRLDGATALFPVYAAFAQAVYPEETRYMSTFDTASPSWARPLHPKNGEIVCSKTDRAYERLIAGGTDIIFCAEPSDEELLMAAARGVEMVLTPIGYEAFVFIVPKDSPAEGLTADEIRGVYSGEITTWEQLGVPGNGEIIAYQRPENSGSQTALENIMGDTELMDAPGYVVDDMVRIVQNVEYRNLPGALGYSFRFFVSGMLKSDVKLLAIDGVAPTIENIENGSYPFISTIYAVTLKGNTNPNTRILLNWLTGDTAQKLLAESGYVGLR